MRKEVRDASRDDGSGNDDEVTILIGQNIIEIRIEVRLVVSENLRLALHALMARSLILYHTHTTVGKQMLESPGGGVTSRVHAG